jgi:hypothetical protein
MKARTKSQKYQDPPGAVPGNFYARLPALYAFVSTDLFAALGRIDSLC